MLLFFDFDGTLSAPRFPKGDGYVSGWTEQAWRDYHETHGEHTFDYCLPVGPVRRYAVRKKEEGHRLFVLTRAVSATENLGKKAFLEKHYPGIFEDYISVDHDGDKIPFIKKMAEENGLGLDQCELVEDTYSLVLQAISAGIIGTHVSNLVALEEFE